MLKHVWKSYRMIQELLKEFPVSHTPIEQQMTPSAEWCKHGIILHAINLATIPLSKKTT